MAQRDKEEESTPLLHTRTVDRLPPDFPYVRAWFVSGLSLVLYMVSGIAIQPVISQYIVERVRVDIYNVTDDKHNDTVICGQTPNTTKDGGVQQEIQKEAAKLTLYYSLVGSSAAIIINTFMGPLSDVLGRKIIYMTPLFGNLIKCIIILFLVHFRMNINFMYLASGIDGLCGSYYAILVATFSYTADVTLPGNSRTIAIAIMEGCLAIAAASGNLVTGYLIKETGYFYPMIMFVCLAGVDLIVVFFFLPETLKTKKRVSKSPLTNIKKVFGFYFTEGTVHRRCVYNILMCIFFFSVVTTLGRSSLETIYQIGEPFCWDSVKIGYFGALRLSVMFLVSILAIKLLHRFMRDESISIISAISAIGGFILEGYADSNLTMYLVPIVGIFGAASIPIARSLMSKITLPSQQGALFASIAVVETVCNSMSNTLYNMVYTATVDEFRGAVWFMMAGLCVIAIFFLVVYKWLAAKGNLEPNHEVEITVNDSDVDSSYSHKSVDIF